MSQKKNIKKEKPFDYKSIKTFEDACKKEGIDPTALPDLSMIPEPMRKALLACYKLFVVFQSINNKWIADYTNWNQAKYYPWFKVLSAGSGFDFSYSYYNCVLTRTAVGSRLCTDSGEKAMYVAKQFSDLYKDLFLIEK